MSTSASQLFPAARQLFATAALNWPTALIKVMVMADSFVPNFATQVNLSDISSADIIATSADITGLGATDGACTGDTTSLGVISDVRVAGGLIFFIDSGSPATSTLVAWFGSQDLPGLPAVLDGLEYFVYKNLSYGGWFRL